MEWLKLGQLTTGQAFFLMWLLGAVVGYCAGRLHAAWRQIDSLLDTIDSTVTKLNKGKTNVK
jgi:hypothetical protein